MYNNRRFNLSLNRWKAHHKKAFSLVEVVLALGVFSFAMISMVALIPSGLLAYQQASNSTAQGQIIESVTSQIELTGIANIAVPFKTTYYFFDSQGTELTNGITTTVTNGVSGILYTAAVNFSYLGSNQSPSTAYSAGNLFTAMTNSSAYNVSIAVTRVSQPLRTNYFSTVIAY